MKTDWEFAARLALVIESGVTTRSPKQTRVAAETLVKLFPDFEKVGRKSGS